MIEITPKDLAVRNARGGESYILLCTLRNETELVLDCNIQTSQASSERWEVTPRAFRMKPRQKQSVELKLSMPHSPPASARRALASGGLKDLFYLKTQYFEQRFHCLVYGDSTRKGRRPAHAREGARPDSRPRATPSDAAAPRPVVVDVEAGLHRLGSRIFDLETREEALQTLVSQLEKLVRDKDEVIRMLQGHLQMSRRGEVGAAWPAPDAQGGGDAAGPPGVGGDGKAQEIASIMGSNAQLRGKVAELSLSLEERENELSITQEALKAISADEPKVETLVAAALEKERAVHESRNRKVLEMFAVKDSQIAQLQSSLDESEATNAEKADLILEFKSQLHATETKVIEVLDENQALQKENYGLKAENAALSQLKPANASRVLEDQLVKTKQMNQMLSSRLREKEALEEFSTVKNESLSESVHELEKSLAGVVTANAEKMKAKDAEIALLLQRIDHTEALLKIKRGREGGEDDGGLLDGRLASSARASTAGAGETEQMLELKQEEVARLKAKLKKLEAVHEKAKETALQSEAKVKDLMQKTKGALSSAKAREEAKDLKARLQSASRESAMKLEQKDSQLKIERAKSKGLMQELVKEKQRSARAAAAFSVGDEREAMERKVEVAAESLKECQDSLQLIHAKYVNSEKEKRQVETDRRNHKAEMSRKLLYAEQKVRVAELHQQQTIRDLEGTIRKMSGRSVDHKEIATARAEVVSLRKSVQTLQSDNDFLSEQISLSEQRLGVAQQELQEHLAFGDLKEFREIYGKYISESVAIVELSKKLRKAEEQVKQAEARRSNGSSAEGANLCVSSSLGPREVHSRGTMALISVGEDSIASESKVTGLQAKLVDLSAHARNLKEKLLAKEKELAAIKDDMLLAKSRKGAESHEWEDSLPGQFVSVDVLEETRRNKRDAETLAQQLEEQLHSLEGRSIDKEVEMKQENTRLCKKLEDSRTAEMETRRQLTEKACKLEEKSVQLKILKEALNALKLGYVSNPCDEDHILLVAKVASAEAKDIAHQSHVEHLVQELDLRSDVIEETRQELQKLREDYEKLQVEAGSHREKNRVTAQHLKTTKSELKKYHDKNIELESKLEYNKERYSKLRMELEVEKQTILNQRKRHFELIAAERESAVEQLERFKVEHCNICESSRKVTRFITDYDDMVSSVIASTRNPKELDGDQLQSCISSMKYLGLEASKLFAMHQTSVHILSTEGEILQSRLRDLELKNECLADKLTLSDGMNILLSGSFQSRSKIVYSLVSNGSQQSHERVRALTSELEQAQMQVLKEHKKKCENSVRGKLLEQKYLQLKCEVQRMKAEREADTPLPEVVGADLTTDPGAAADSDPGAIAQAIKFKLVESHLIQQVQAANKRAEQARTELKELAGSFRELAEKVAEHVSETDDRKDTDLEVHMNAQAELTLRAKEVFELSQKMKHLSIETNLQKNETMVANKKVEMLEMNLKDSLRVLDAALSEQKREQQEILASVIDEARAEVSMTFNSIYSMVKASRESTRNSRDLIQEDFKQIRVSAKDHSIHTLANLSYLDIEGIPVVKVSELRDLKLQKQFLEQENGKLVSRLESKEKEVLELTEDVESQKLALRDLSNTFSKSAFKKLHSSGMMKSTISTLNKKLVESKLVQADMQRKLKISARAELELRQLLHSREQRLTTLNTEVRAYNQALDSIQKFAAKEKNLEFKRILREVVLNLSATKSNHSPSSRVEADDRGDFKIDARLGVFSGLRIQVAEKNARISHLEQRLAEYLASTPIKQQAQQEDGSAKDMLREVSKFNKVLKQVIEGAISKIKDRVAVEDEPASLDEAIEILLDKVKHAELMLGRSVAQTKALKGKMKDSKTEDVNVSLENAVKGLSDKCRALVMEKAEIKLERDRLQERLKALKTSTSKTVAEPKRRDLSKHRKTLLSTPLSAKKPVRVLASEVRGAEVNETPLQVGEEGVEGGLASQFQQVDSFADMIEVHLAAIQDFVVKSLNAPGLPVEATHIEEDFASISSLVCVIKDTLKILASDVSDKGVVLPPNFGFAEVNKDKLKRKDAKESEWETKYSSLKQAYSTYRKSSKIEMKALKEKNMNASAQVIEAAKDKVSMQAELREMQRMVDKGIIEVESRQKSRSNLALKLTEREAQLRIAKSKAKFSEDHAQTRIEELEKDLKSAAGTITEEREERAKILIILRKAVNDLKTQLHIEFELRNQLYAMELEKDSAVNSFENKENQLNSELKGREETESKVKDLEDSLVQERQLSHKLKVRYEYMREGLKQLEIRFNAADKHRVMLERCVEFKLNEAERIADSINVVDFGKAPMMILLEVQEIEKLINKMSLEIQKAQKRKDVSSDRWKYTAQLARYKRVVTDWKKGEQVRLKKKISELKASMSRMQNQNSDLVLCSEKAADTIGNLQGIITRLERERDLMTKSLHEVKELYSVEMTKLRIQSRTEAMLEQQHVVDALNRDIESTETELEELKGELNALKGIVKVDAKKIISEFHEISDASRREILGMMSSLSALIPGLGSKAKGGPIASRHATTPKERGPVSGSGFTSDAIQEIQNLEEGAGGANDLELKLRIQCQLTKKTERRVAQLKAEVQSLKQELGRQERKYESYPTKEALDERDKAFAECKKSLKESRALCSVRLKEIRSLKDELVEVRSKSAEKKLAETTERLEILQRRLRDSSLSIQRKDVIISDLRQSVRDLQQQDLTEKWSKTEAKNKQLALTVQRQSAAIRELRTSATQVSKTAETAQTKEREKAVRASDMQKRYRSDLKRKDTIIAQMGDHLRQLEEELAGSTSAVEEAAKKEAHGKKAAEHDWITFKTFMKNAVVAVEKMSKIVVQGSNELRGVVQTVQKAERFQGLESSAKSIARLVEMSPSEVEDIMRVEEVQAKEENLESYLMRLFGDMTKSIEGIHRSNLARGKEKFVASWDPSVLLSIVEILEKDFIQVRHQVAGSMEVLPEVVAKQPAKKRRAPSGKKQKAKRGGPSPGSAGTPGRSGRDMLVEELEILARRVRE
ncbi:hypothetical protein HKI87_03g23060 [Chloropicon roscoffensis]|uniref:Uncharacterized protein n=1 Tax=Chloropicon roscoffensis TaxID=1461544 RepID=A0AAX4P393_9CHLO